jgi:predicted  nucleic acid-binding Zn ribbon protein
MYSISIRYGNEIDENEVWHSFYMLLGFLQYNGQLIGRFMEPYAKDGRISAVFPTATQDALDTKYQKKTVIHLSTVKKMQMVKCLLAKQHIK